jgi:hypothetical protein
MALVSCTFPGARAPKFTLGETIPVWLDPSFTPGETWGILAAFEDWNVALNGALRFASGATPQEVSLTVTRESATDPTNHGQPPGCMAWVNKIGGLEVYVEPDKVEWAGYPIKSVVEHEIGHTLGLPHDSAGLMAPTATITMCIDGLTIDVLSRAHGWGRERLKEVCP